MMKHGIDDKAIKDDDLWESIRRHRGIYTSISGMDYTPDIRKSLVLIPREYINIRMGEVLYRHEG